MSSAKNPCDTSFAMQSSPVTINFSFCVSTAICNGSKISLGFSAPLPDFTNSKAWSTEVLNGVDRFASRDAAIVSRAVVKNTGETKARDPLVRCEASEAIEERLSGCDDREGREPGPGVDVRTEETDELRC
jgi:hypothetical protein